jgi:glycosyltransferase involved in cell wall biosynthesis
MKPRVLFLFYNNPDTYPPIVNSARLLADAGFAVDIICRDNGERWNVSYPREVHVKRIRAEDKGGGALREYSNFIVQVVRHTHRRTHVFIGHDMHGFLVARLLGSRYQRPVVYHCHDFSDRRQALNLGGTLVRFFEQIFARTADIVIVPDYNRGQVMKKALRLRKEPIVVANAPIGSPEDKRNRLRAALNEHGVEMARIVFRQGRIGRGHAIEATLRSMPLWASLDWGFVVMGTGEPDYIKGLQDLAADLGVDKRFVVLPPVSYDDVLTYTSGADLGHALYEPIHINNEHISTASNKIMEYMASGIPLLVSDTPALRGLVEKYQCGLAADETSPTDVARAVNILLQQPDRARQMGEAGRSAFDRVFRYEAQFGRATRVIAQLAARR